MEGKKINCKIHVVGYKHTGRFDQYGTLVGKAFQELKEQIYDISSRTETIIALYEPKRGEDHVEGYFYVGVVVEEKPDQLPKGSEYIYVEGSYVSSKGKKENIGEIYGFIDNWIREKGYKQVWPSSLIIERYESTNSYVPLEKEVEVLLPVE